MNWSRHALLCFARVHVCELDGYSLKLRSDIRGIRQVVVDGRTWNRPGSGGGALLSGSCLRHLRSDGTVLSCPSQSGGAQVNVADVLAAASRFGWRVMSVVDGWVVRREYSM
jgi:hypothetical protein